MQAPTDDVVDEVKGIFYDSLDHLLVVFEPEMSLS